MRLIALILTLVLVVSPAHAASQPTYSLCLSKTGGIVARTKCKRSETKASIQNLNSAGIKSVTGPQGPQGVTGPAGDTGPKGDTGDSGPKGFVNFATCYNKPSNLSSNLPTVTVSATCNNASTQFMLNWSYATTPVQPGSGILPIVWATDFIFNGNVPVGMQFTATNASVTNNGIQAQGFITCCSRN